MNVIFTTDILPLFPVFPPFTIHSDVTLTIPVIQFDSEAVLAIAFILRSLTALQMMAEILLQR